MTSELTMILPVRYFACFRTKRNSEEKDVKGVTRFEPMLQIFSFVHWNIKFQNKVFLSELSNGDFCVHKLKSSRCRAGLPFACTFVGIIITLPLEKIVVWCCMSRKRIVGPFFFFTSTITRDVYQNIVQQFVSHPKIIVMASIEKIWYRYYQYFCGKVSIVSILFSCFFMNSQIHTSD